MSPSPRRLPRGAAALVLAALSACLDAPTTVLPPGDEAPPVLAAVRCTASRTALILRCGAPALPAGIDGLIVGGQGQYVFLSGEGVTYSTETQQFEFDASVQNLIPQALGTTDGSSGTAEGVRVFFSIPPTPITGTGGITVLSDGQATFTAANQHYFQYSDGELGADGLLSPNESSSAQRWVFEVPLNVETFDFEVYVAAAVQFPDGWVEVSPAADTLLAGAGQTLTATVRTVVGNPVPGAPVAWGSADTGVATVDGSGNVTTLAPGTATITATSGARTGSASIAVCPDLALGGVFVADMPAGSSFCLGGGAGREYVVIPVNLAEPASVALELTGSGIVPVSGPPTPDLLRGTPVRTAGSGGPERDFEFERRLRLRERREVGRGGAAAASRGPRRAITPGVPSVGALMSLNVETDNACATNDIRTGRVMAVGTTVIVIADTTNPSGGLSAAQYAAIADSFDAVIHPTVTGNFGAPHDIDGNGRVIAFYTRAVNELTPGGSGSYVGGFFFSRDLRPAAECPTSNVGEMLYMLAADPAGTVNGNVRTVSFVLDQTMGTLAHELEHLVNASRRMYLNGSWSGELEAVWLDEALAHVAEELVFYQAAGLAPEQNLDITDLADAGVVEATFFKYQEPNFGRLRRWLLAPVSSGPFQGDDDLATRGSGWAFLRYAADRRGGSQAAFWSGLVNTQNTGITNLEAVLGTDAEPWFRDFAAAMYVDDAVGTPAAAYTQPSWHFREIFTNLDYSPGPGCSCAYELDVLDPANGVAATFSLSGGGSAAYGRMGVAAGAFAGVTLRSGGVSPPSTVRLAVIRRE